MSELFEAVYPSPGGGGAAGVSSIIPGTAIGVAPASGLGNVTINNLGVTSAIAGTGIAVNTATGGVTFSTTAVLALTAGTAIGITGTNANLTINNLGVTSIAGGGGVTVNVSTGAITLGTANIPLTALAQGGAVANQVLSWSGTAWAPAAAGGGGTNIANGTGSLTLDGNGGGLKTAAGTAPTSAPAANVTSATLVTGSTDAAGAVDIVISGVAPAGNADLFTLTFAIAFTNPPFVMVTRVYGQPAGTQVSILDAPWYVASVASSSFTVRCGNAMTANGVFRIAYMVIGS